MIHSQDGFSAVELLITLFIAAIFVLAGYQLYSYVLLGGTEASEQAEASRIAYTYLVNNKPATCSAGTPVNNQAVTDTTLYQAHVTVTVSCPFPTPIQTVSLVTSSVQYTGPSSTETVSHAEYVY